MQNTILILIIIFSVISCNSQGSENADYPNNQDTKKEKSSATSEKIEEQAQKNNVFAWKLYEQLLAKTPDKNVFYSPYSISSALAMTYVGAKGNTAKEMQETLHFDENEPHQAFSGLIDAIETKKTSYQLNVANSLWPQKNYKISPLFKSATAKNYGANLHEVDFIKNSEQARKTINKWIADNTNQKIKELLTPKSITGETRLVLTNAIYFKGDWQTAFDSSLTAKDTFHLNNVEKIDVDMMAQGAPRTFSYYENESFQVVQFSYKGNEVAMNLFLPREDKKIELLELTAQKMQNAINKMRKTKVAVKMPKLKTRYKFSAKEVLQKMGMREAFSMEADFSGITGNKELRIDNVIHEAFVEINEEGTEAAAATGVVMNRKSAPARPISFFVNRPFIFTINHIKTNSTLFIGRIVNPTQ